MSDESDCLFMSSECNSVSFHVSDGSADELTVNSDSSLSNGSKVSQLNESSFCSQSTYDDSSIVRSSSSAIQELDRAGIWVSSLDLKLEDSELLQLKDNVDLSELDFPSPSFSCRKILCSGSSLSRGFENDKPLFWPYDQKLYKFFELGKNFLCISPRKDLRKLENKGVNGINNIQVSRSSKQEVCRRKIEFNNNSIKSCSHTSSRLIRSSAQPPTNQFPCNSFTSKGSGPTKKETLQLKFKSLKLKQVELPKKSLLEFEANCFQEFLVEGFSIEKLVGLDEFDGHQGLTIESS